MQRFGRSKFGFLGTLIMVSVAVFILLAFRNYWESLGENGLDIGAAVALAVGTVIAFGFHKLRKG